MAKQIITIESVIAKYKALNHKRSFIELMAEKLGMNADYLQMVWFQHEYKIKPDKLEFVNCELDRRKIYEHKKAELLKNLETN